MPKCGTTAVLLCLVSVSCLGQSTKDVVQPTLHETLLKTSSVTAASGVAPGVAKALNRLLPRNAKNERTAFYRIPRYPHLYAVTTDAPASQSSDYGIALYVFERQGKIFKQIFRSKGMNDSYFLRPTFFVGQNRTLVMAETGDESGTWALHAFEVTPAGVIYLGELDAARRDPNVESWSNPIENAMIEFVNKQYVVHLRGEIYLHPGSGEEKQLPGHGWHRFVLHKNRFIPAE